MAPFSRLPINPKSLPWQALLHSSRAKTLGCWSRRTRIKRKKRLRLESSISLGTEDMGEVVVLKKNKKIKLHSESTQPSIHHLPSSTHAPLAAQVLWSSIDFSTCLPFAWIVTMWRLWRLLLKSLWLWGMGMCLQSLFMWLLKKYSPLKRLAIAPKVYVTPCASWRAMRFELLAQSWSIIQGSQCLPHSCINCYPVQPEWGA